ncbi:hypothetical protein G9A89_023612 [Geosiphon pyriformis]|nr:hypothetical protein G9A89_023612 [Geosiphon pyriformis]
MSGTGAKRRSSKVLTSGSVSSGSSHKVKKSLGGVKLSSNSMALKDSGSGQVVGQFNSMDTDGEASEGEGVSNSKMNTSQAKHFNNSAIVGFLLGSINFDIEEKEKISFPSCKSFSLNKVWINPKIIKTQVEMAVKKSFALDINLLAVEGISAMAKTHAIRKLFSRINGFGEATIPLKFEGIIRSTFISEASIEKATSLAKKNDIIVNSDFKKQGIRSDWTVVIKKISMDMPKDMIVAAVSEFGEIKSIRIQLIGMWQKAMWSFLIRKNSVHVARAVKDRDVWASRDRYRALLFTLPMETTVHDLGTLLDKVGGRTCIINCLLKTDNRFYCAVARFDLVCCRKCGCLGHSALKCDVSNVSPSELLSSSRKPLARLYAKKNVPISCPAAFGGKSWAQVVSLASSSGSFSSGSGAFSLGVSDLSGGFSLLTNDNSSLNTHLASLECILDVPAATSFDMILDDTSHDPVVALLLPLVGSDLGSSSSKVLTSKMGSLESKLVALNASVGAILGKLDQLCTMATCNMKSINNPAKQKDIVQWHKNAGNMISVVTETKLKRKVRPWIMNKFDGVRVFTSGLEFSYLGTGVAIIMDVSLAKHVCKISEVLSWLISVKLLFKNKLSVTVLGLYAGATLEKRLAHSHVVNLMVAEALNGSTFVVLGGDFNKNDSGCSANFKKCLDLGFPHGPIQGVFISA